jgi:NodT family efflux transporter outer membrane factor (OMF) lipoprotein
LRRYCSILLLVTLAACAPTAGRLAAPRPVSDFAADRSLAAPAAPWPGNDWWTAYGDPQLDALIAQAQIGSPTLAAAAARVRQANALAQQAGAAMLPAVTATGRAGLAKQSYNNGIPAEFVPHGWNDTGQLSLEANFDLDLWGLDRAALAAATSEAEAAQVDAAQAELLLSSDIASAYADLARLFSDRDIAQQALEVREATLKLIRERVANGLDNRGTEQLAESRAAAARGDIAATDEAIGLTRNRIAALLGAGPDRGLAIARPQIGRLHSPGLPARLALDLIGRRPDIVSARLRAEAATHSIRSARAAFYPNINLTALIGLQSLGLSNLLDSGSTMGSVGPAVSLPIFNRGRLVGELRGAEAQSDLAVANYDATLVEALHEVADAAGSIRALETRRRDAQAALTAAAGAYSIARQRYEGGLATYIDVLTAEDTVLDRRRTLTELDARAFTLDVALMRALGGGFSDPFPSRAAAAPQGASHG